MNINLSDVERKALGGTMSNLAYDAGDIDDEAPDMSKDEDSYWAYHAYHGIRKLLCSADSAAPGGDVEQGYWIVQRTDGATIIHNAESGDSCTVDDNDSNPTTEILRQLAQDAMTWGRPTARIVGMRLIDGVAVQVAKPASELLPEILLVTYDEYLKVAALSAPKQVGMPDGWVLVPRKASGQMVEAMAQFFSNESKWGAAIAASQKAAPKQIDANWSRHDRIEFALRDAGFSPGEAAEMTARIEAPQPVEAEGREAVARKYPVAWHTDNFSTDKSATTYDRTVADRWRAKGWPVTPLYTAPPPEQPAKALLGATTTQPGAEALRDKHHG